MYKNNNSIFYIYLRLFLMANFRPLLTTFDQGSCPSGTVGGTLLFSPHLAVTLSRLVTRAIGSDVTRNVGPGRPVGSYRREKRAEAALEPRGPGQSFTRLSEKKGAPNRRAEVSP